MWADRNIVPLMQDADRSGSAAFVHDPRLPGRLHAHGEVQMRQPLCQCCWDGTFPSVTWSIRPLSIAEAAPTLERPVTRSLQGACDEPAFGSIYYGHPSPLGLTSGVHAMSRP